jgi:hypothetical protein
VSVEAFRQAFEVARMAYDPGLLADPALERQVKQNLLEELLREALIVERGIALGLTVAPEDLQAAIDRIRQDYPEGAFDAMLLQRAVPFPFWAARLRRRMLVEKVVAAELEGEPLTSAEVQQGVQALPPGEAQALAAAGEGSDLRERFLDRLRRLKVEAAFPQWFERLQAGSRLQIDPRRRDEVLAP